ncbi:hypothetical protein B6S12_10250, partial [Helicobacter valdiviensis]
MNEELEREVLLDRELSQIEKDLQNALKHSDMDKIGEELLKEVEEENLAYQNNIQNIQGVTSFVNNALDIGSQTFKTLEPYLLPFKIIIKRADNTLSVIDGIIEYQKTGDGLKVIAKLATGFIVDTIFVVGTKIIIAQAISAFVAMAVYAGSITLGVLVGVVIITIGVAALWWISSGLKEWLEKHGISLDDLTTNFTPQELKKINVAHCHRAYEKKIQSLQIYYQGKIYHKPPQLIPHYQQNQKAFRDILKEEIKKTNSQKMQNFLEILNYELLSSDKINSIQASTDICYLKALYQCESYIQVSKDSFPFLNKKNMENIFGVNSSFYRIFIQNKKELTQDYIEARKSLYRSIEFFKWQRYREYFNPLNNVCQNIDKENNLDSKGLKQNITTIKQNPNLLTSHSKNLNHFILENKDKNK